jgi:hypothetical protein
MGADETEVKPALGIRRVAQRVTKIKVGAEDLSVPHCLQKLCNINSIFQIDDEIIVVAQYFRPFFPGKAA